MEKSHALSRSLIHLFILAFVVFSIFPFLVMIFGSLKTSAELSTNPAGWPRGATVHNFVRLLNANSGKMVRTFFNGVYVSAVHCLLLLVISSLAAYAFAKCRFRGKKVIFAMLIATMFIPMEITIPPLYVLFSKIKWLNTYIVQILPGIANVFSLFLMRQYMATIPNALLESARIDGANHLSIYRSIIMPMSRPIVGALAILMFLGKWNDFLWPQIMVTKIAKLPIIVLLPTLNDTSFQMFIPWELVLTGCFIVTLPLVVVFMIFQNKFMASVAIGAVKE
jgi:ABC-type glycerol-3-phosphate transport system permease component